MTWTLTVDCGGGGIRASVLDAAGTPHVPTIRVPTPYPLPPGRLVSTIVDLATRLPAADRVTVGMPGMIRHGVVVATPHYVTAAGPRTPVLPQLAQAWAGRDIAADLQAALSRPVLVLNDAELHGAGVVSGAGVELVLTLGTGLGSALFDGGALAPHLELSHAPIRRGTYDTWLGEPERRRLGAGPWSRRVRRAVDGLRPVFCWDRLYLGGGNAQRVTPRALAGMGDDVVVVPNAVAISGGVRAWALVGAPGEHPRGPAGHPPDDPPPPGPRAEPG